MNMVFLLSVTDKSAEGVIMAYCSLMILVCINSSSVTGFIVPYLL